MKVLIIGSGGREHALAWKIQQSKRVKHIYCAPGNAGIMQIADCFPVQADDLQGLLDLALEKQVDLTVVGPEVPLTEGIVDLFNEKGLKIFGPSKAAAQIEGSKTFAKDLMKKYGIPTADYKTFSNASDALHYVDEIKAPLVVKADGLAAGKGALVCMTEDEAKAAINEIMVEKKFGGAGNSVVIEEFLTGEEASVFVLTDGKEFLTLPPSQDHKPVYDDDKGPNTGGMGAYAPAPLVDVGMIDHIEKTIIRPTIDAMASEGIPYKGLLYAGLMITEHGPKVIEFNCRFGDPETQVVLPLIENDIIELFEHCIDGSLGQCQLQIANMYAVCVVLASRGYPGSYEKGKEIYGLEKVFLGGGKNIFHAGTKMEGNKIVTNGGRVLCVTSVNSDLEWAISSAYSLVDEAVYDGRFCRSDIGRKGLKRIGSTHI